MKKVFKIFLSNIISNYRGLKKRSFYIGKRLKYKSYEVAVKSRVYKNHIFIPAFLQAIIASIVSQFCNRRPNASAEMKLESIGVRGIFTYLLVSTTGLNKSGKYAEQNVVKGTIPEY